MSQQLVGVNGLVKFPLPIGVAVGSPGELRLNKILHDCIIDPSCGHFLARGYVHLDVSAYYGEGLDGFLIDVEGGRQCDYVVMMDKLTTTRDLVLFFSEGCLEVDALSISQFRAPKDCLVNQEYRSSHSVFDVSSVPSARNMLWSDAGVLDDVVRKGFLYREGCTKGECDLAFLSPALIRGMRGRFTPFKGIPSICSWFGFIVVGSLKSWKFSSKGSLSASRIE
jgi:hypothetical protein